MAKVLIVDDSRLTRRIVTSALTTAGHDCLQAADGEEGLALYRAEAPDCVVTDLLMPRMDGFGLAEAIRESDEATPIVVVSADIQQSSRERCEAAGVDRMLTKPAKAPEISEAVAEVIAQRQAAGA